MVRLLYIESIMKNLYKSLLLIFVVLWPVLHLRAQETYVYKVCEDDTLQVDLYRPLSARSDRACVVYLHDGGFRAGSRCDTLSRSAAESWASRGFAVVSVDYRLTVKKMNFDGFGLSDVVPAAERIFGSVVEDCCDAVAFVVAHADDWNIDTSKIILAGSSAGAIAVLQADYCRCNALDWAASLPAGFRPAAVVSYSGGVYSHDGAIKYALPPAPTCFFHGTKDRIVNYKQMAWFKYRFAGSSKLSSVFRDGRFPYWFFRIDGHAHDVFHMMPNTVDEFVAFVDMALSGRYFLYETDCYDVQIETEPRFSQSLLNFVR